MAFGDDRIKDMVVDKKIESVSSGFMNFLFKNNNRGNFNSTYSSIRHYWTKFSKLQDTINVLTLICAKYWKVVVILVRVVMILKLVQVSMQ